MKNSITFLFLAFAVHINAYACDNDINEKLSELIKKGKLSQKTNTTDKYEKLTDHDDPIFCKTEYKSKKYTVYTDEQKECLIVQDTTNNVNIYYGVYCI